MKSTHGLIIQHAILVYLFLCLFNTMTLEWLLYQRIHLECDKKSVRDFVYCISEIYYTSGALIDIAAYLTVCRESLNTERSECVIWHPSMSHPVFRPYEKK